MRPEVQDFIAEADVVLAVGTELSETDSFVERLKLPGTLIRVDIDPRKMTDLYPAEVAILADAGQAMAALRAALEGHDGSALRSAAEAWVTALRAEIAGNLTPAEKKHARLLAALLDCAPPETVFSGDACQLVYTGAFTMPMAAPRQWFYPAGYCALGNGLPNGIGAKLRGPRRRSPSWPATAASCSPCPS